MCVKKIKKDVCATVDVYLWFMRNNGNTLGSRSKRRKGSDLSDDAPSGFLPIRGSVIFRESCIWYQRDRHYSCQRTECRKERARAAVQKKRSRTRITLCYLCCFFVTQFFMYHIWYYLFTMFQSLRGHSPVAEYQVVVYCNVRRFSMLRHTPAAIPGAIGGDVENLTVPRDTRQQISNIIAYRLQTTANTPIQEIGTRTA